MNHVLDACAALAFLLNEPGADQVEAALLDDDGVSYIHALNACEVFYHVHRHSGEADAQHALEQLRNAGAEFREDLDAACWQEAGASSRSTGTSPSPTAAR